MLIGMDVAALNSCPAKRQQKVEVEQFIARQNQTTPQTKYNMQLSDPGQSLLLHSQEGCEPPSPQAPGNRPGQPHLCYTRLPIGID